jgi:hypothetical protein
MNVNLLTKQEAEALVKALTAHNQQRQQRQQRQIRQCVAANLLKDEKDLVITATVKVMLSLDPSL